MGLYGHGHGIAWAMAASLFTRVALVRRQRPSLAPFFFVVAVFFSDPRLDYDTVGRCMHLDEQRQKRIRQREFSEPACFSSQRQRPARP
jgi:hypothetical protein